MYMYNTCTSISVALIMSFEDIPITNFVKTNTGQYR